jgi:mRNA-degrading endonuclease RelE of RelBE toxin-antitoxin system
MAGIPELPKPSAGLINIPPAVAAQLQKLPSEQRAQFLNKILRQKQLLQQQQLQQQQQKNDTLAAGSSQQINLGGQV